MRVCVKPGCDREIPEDAPETRVYCDGRCRTAHWRLKRETPKRVKPSGRQVSYEKAVRALADHFVARGEPSFVVALDEAAAVLYDALPVRQRTPR